MRSKALFILLTFLGGYWVGSLNLFSKNEAKANREDLVTKVSSMLKDSRNNSQMQCRKGSNFSSVSSKEEEVVPADGSRGESDTYEFEVQRKELLEKWNESIVHFFEDHFELGAAEKMKAYQMLKHDMEEEMDKNWYKTMKKRKINEHEYLYNTAYEEEIEQMNIRSKFLIKLKRLLGEIVFNELRQKIMNYKLEQVERVKAGLYPGEDVNF